MPSCDKLLTSSVAKATTRELPNKGANLGNMSQGTSALPKEKGPSTADPGKAVVTKRQNSETPSSPGYHNVYVRRKVESEHNKVNSSQELKGNGKDKTKEQEAPLQDVQHDEVTNPQVASAVDKPVEASHVDEPVEASHVDKPVEASHVDKPVEASHVDKPVEASHVDKPVEASHVDKLVEASHVDKPVEESHVDKPVEGCHVDKPVEASHVDKPVEASHVDKPIEASHVDTPVEVEVISSVSSEKTSVETMPEKAEPPTTSATGIQDDAEQLSIQYWSERFNRLQTYLENCDRSTQEGYLRKLRSLSAAGRSMHAIELEKRAIHLLVEEEL
ncbi:hypothetical protein PR202_ga11349 [Eleusine coracana subsp. coracana]|uniref:Uncharacterized protein n=1 Tax=Eleusine coracana subsp. coracana TaxID=191504 RepID=A0AAV5C8T4_ELECO|nr:hypothetical protein PR202_ga11349 [Eleusine coracana subsp. coracana]